MLLLYFALSGVFFSFSFLKNVKMVAKFNGLVLPKTYGLFFGQFFCPLNTSCSTPIPPSQPARLLTKSTLIWKIMIFFVRPFWKKFLQNQFKTVFKIVLKCSTKNKIIFICVRMYFYGGKFEFCCLEENVIEITIAISSSIIVRFFLSSIKRKKR